MLNIFKGNLYSKATTIRNKKAVRMKYIVD